MSDDELLDRAEESLTGAKQAAEKIPDQLGHEGADAPMPPLTAADDPAAAEAQAREADPDATADEPDDATSAEERDATSADEGPADDAEREDPSVVADEADTADDAEV